MPPPDNHNAKLSGNYNYRDVLHMLSIIGLNLLVIRSVLDEVGRNFYSQLI